MTADRILLLALLGLALALRLPGIDEQLWFDEVQLLVELVRKPFLHVVSSYENDNNHPLYSVLAWLSARAFGEHPWALRLPAFLFGVLGVGAVFALARDLAGRREAALAALLVALSGHHVSFSQSARGYTGLFLFTVLATLELRRILHTKDRGSWIRQGLWLGLAASFHLTGVYVAVAHLLVWLGVLWRRPLFERRLREPLQAIALGGALALLLHALMLAAIVRFFLLREGRRAVSSEWTSPYWTLVEAVRSFGLDTPAGWALIAIAIAFVCVGAASLFRREPATLAGFVLPGAVGLALTLALGRNVWPRFFFSQGGFGAILLVRGVLAAAAACAPRGGAAGRALARALRAAAFIGLPLLSIPRLVPEYALPKQDFLGARAFVEAHRAPGDPVLTVGLGCYPYLHHYAPEWTVTTEIEDLEAIRAAHPRVLVVTTFPVFLRANYPDLYGALADRGRFEEVARFRGNLGDGDVIVLRPRQG